MTSLVASFETNFRHTAAALLRAMIRGAQDEAQAAADLVLHAGMSQGALWRRGDHLEFVPAEPVRDAVSALAAHSYPDRAAFLKAASEAGLTFQLSPIRF